MKLSILMPAYNEAATVATAIKRVLAVEFPCETELVVVDDGSTDDTRQVLEGIEDTRLSKLFHPFNRGKGAAVRTASRVADGDYAIIFDADLEYSPDDILKVLTPVINRDAEVVFGTRTFGGASAYSFVYVMGNKVTTFAANALFNAWLSDLHCCLKLLPLPLLWELGVESNGFGADTEIAAKLLARRVRPFEVPIGYRARTHAEGKKITWRDGLDALRILVRIRVTGNASSC